MIIKSRDDLAKCIKIACTASGVTLSELGRRLGVIQPSISRTVNRADFPFSELLRIASALGCDLEISIMFNNTESKDTK